MYRAGAEQGEDERFEPCFPGRPERGIRADSGKDDGARIERENVPGGLVGDERKEDGRDEREYREKKRESVAPEECGQARRGKLEREPMLRSRQVLPT